MRPSTIALLVGVLGMSAVATPQNQDSVSPETQVERKYDRFQNETTISVENDLPEAKATDTDLIWSVKLIVEHPCKGDVEQCSGNELGISFLFINRIWRFQNASITFLVDGTPAPATKVIYNGSVLSAYQLMESVSTIIPLTTFRKIATAKSVEVQIGTTEFALSDKSLDAFRAIS
jgi:hypothetical protein